jgi:segregation and condensation protein B
MATETRRAIEAILMVADQPIEAQLLAQVTETSIDDVESLLREMADEFRDQRGFVLVEIAGGWRFQSHADFAPYVERFVLEGQTARLSAAALETLAIVAYKQPISRLQISAIRGVNVDGVVRTLEHRGYIGEVGRDLGPGQPVLFGTTPLFLERLGLADIAELPPVADFVPSADVVEALEQGLRVDPEPVDRSAADDDAPDVHAVIDIADAEPEMVEAEEAAARTDEG